MSTKMLLNSIYNPPRALRGNKTVEGYYAKPDLQTYAVAYPFARQALLEGLKLFNLPVGAKVLLPEFICRDVLSAFNQLGFVVQYYGVGVDLVINCPVDELPKCDAIMAVHYFGLTTDLKLFKEYCAKHNSYLIVDNAHGFLSERDGVKLGTEGDIGIISVRKTLPIKNGAILISKKPVKLPHLTAQKAGILSELKNSLRPFVAMFGVRILLWVTQLKRTLRKIIKGSELPLSYDTDEYDLPNINCIAPYNEYFATVDVAAEIKRRRDLYAWVNELCADLPVKKIRTNLNEGECPYGYPFYCKDEDLEKVQKFFLKNGLEMISWPALPKAVQLQAPPHYKELYLVKFLW